MIGRWIHTPKKSVIIGTLAVAVALCALVAAGSACADTNRVEIVNAATHLRADVMWASAQDGQGVFLWPDNTSASQLFALVYTGSSGSGLRFFQIRARHSGRCLMLQKDQPGSGTVRGSCSFPPRAALNGGSATCRV